MKKCGRGVHVHAQDQVEAGPQSRNLLRERPSDLKHPVHELANEHHSIQFCLASAAYRFMEPCKLSE